ncbi:M23 family metallopeptidase [Cloacibacterium normanense]|uniref:M23 family metallopeptidase n=1 Tax=Cloacibacterium normanense TaxID=237258 RepID=UPI00391A8C41
MFLKIILPILFFIETYAFAQFNTIAPIQIEKKENVFKIIPSKERDSSLSIMKISWKKFLIQPTKSKLKKQVDSLKNLLYLKNEMDVLKDKINLKKIEDSLVEVVKRRIEIEFSNRNSFKTEMAKIKFNRISKIAMPLKNVLKITSDFGNRLHPISQNFKLHNGIDLSASYEDVYAVLDGIVSESGYDENGGGKYMKILHSNRFETSYLHLSNIYYKKGEWVKAGFIIAKSGNSGSSTAPHLHFSVKEFGKFISPIEFLKDLKQTQYLIEKNYEYSTFTIR